MSERYAALDFRNRNSSHSAQSIVRKSSQAIWITLLPPFSLYALHTSARFHRHQITQQHHNNQHQLIRTNNRDLQSDWKLQELEPSFFSSPDIFHRNH
ncbi:hypothetical protein Q7C36_022462 [Tachysurus vachellii]|uniref:Uncharacterized protein n=1 Tax=Tachysurus vachellii TaxID=175792 RepID=A0AA88IMV3_TACVA|nr:hypothetical protein Q7C36_022462 [Tachysurus vachellii]